MSEDIFLGAKSLSEMTSAYVITERKTSDEYNQDEVSFVLSKYEEARQSRQAKYDPIWDEAYKLYNSQLDESKTKSGKWRNKMFVPLSFALIEDIHPNMMDAFFSQDDFLEVAPGTEEDIAGVDAVKTLTSYQLREKVKIFFKLFDGFKQMEMYGVSPIFIDFQKRKRKIKKLKVNKMTDTGKRFLEPVETEVLEYNDPEWRVRDVYDVFPSPFSTRDYQPYIIDRGFISYEDLKQQVEANPEIYDLDQFNQINPSSDCWMGLDDMKTVRGNVFGLSNQYYSLTRTNLLEVFNYWEDYRMITVVARKYKIRSHKESIFYHGKKPFIFLHYTPQIHEFYSKGAIEPIAPLQHDTNRIRNQRRDNVSLVLNKMWEVVASALEDENELVWQPSGIIHTSAPGMVREIPMSDVTANSYMEENLNRSDMLWTHSITEAIKGISGSTRKTASEAHELLAMAQSRLKLCVLYNQKEIQEGLKLHHSLNQQHLTQDYVVRVAGKNGYQFVPISIYDIQGNYDFVFNVSTTALNQNIARNQFATMTNQFMTNPETMKRVDWDKWMKIAVRYFGYKESDGLVIEMNKEESINAIMQQYKEIVLMMEKTDVPTNMIDNDDIHMETMDMFMKQNNIFTNEELFPIFNKHYQAHKAQKIQKQMIISSINKGQAVQGANQITEGNIMAAEGGRLGG